MALSSVLSEKALAKFRTKVCERRLASGTCSFGERCQYSHLPRPRRNPKKFIYSPTRCSASEACVLGNACPLAHTQDEEHFHPQRYKTTLCRRDHTCGGYYCPFAHTSEELRSVEGAFNDDKVLIPPPGLEKDDAGSSCPGEPVASSGDPVGKEGQDKGSMKDAFWYAGDQGDLRVSLEGEVSSGSSCGQALVGGTLRTGFFSPKNGIKEVPCLVKLLPISRMDSQFAAQVVKEVRRWLQHNGSSDNSVVRRTVATTVLAMPLQPSTLGMSVQSFRCSLAKQLCSSWQLVQLVARWVKQLVVGTQALHQVGLSHLCLGPETVSVSKAGVLQIGDFLGKVKSLRLIETGWQGLPEEAWAIWYPPEVHKQVATPEHPATLAHEPVDAWQLGILVFFLLTGEHPFGDLSDPRTVFANISMDNRINHGHLGQLPLFADLVGRLMTRKPKDRSLPAQAIGHPLLWSMDEACLYTESLWTDTQVPSWLLHLPALAPFGGTELPPLPSAPGRNADNVVRSLCDRALRSAATVGQAPLQQPTSSNVAKKERKVALGAPATAKPGPDPAEREGGKALPCAPKAPGAAPAAEPAAAHTLPLHVAALAVPGAQVFLTVPPHMAASIAPAPLRTPPESLSVLDAQQLDEDLGNQPPPCHVPLNKPVKTQPSWLGAAPDRLEPCSSWNLSGRVDEPEAGMDAEPAFVTPSRSTALTDTMEFPTKSNSSTPDPDFLRPKLFPSLDTTEWGASDGLPAPVTPPLKPHVPLVISCAMSAASGWPSPVSELHGGHAVAVGGSEKASKNTKLDWCEKIDRLLALLDERA